MSIIYDNIMSRMTLTKLIVIYVTAVTLFSTPTNQQQQELASDTLTTDGGFYEAARKLLLEGDTETIARGADKSVPYFRASIPMRIFECLRDFSVLRCTKLFMLQKMQDRTHFPSTGNVTRDFLDQFFGHEEEMGSLVAGTLANISDRELNQRLVWNFQRFFKKRDIQLHFLPGLMVKIIPSKENKLKFALKKKSTPRASFAGRRSRKSSGETVQSISAFNDDEVEAEMKKQGGGGGGGGGNSGGGGSSGGAASKKHKKKRHSYKDTIIQMAVPVMIMPAILMGSFLPFLLPVLKMATLMSMLLNNSAFIAALIYAARTHVNAQDDSAQHINYGQQVYH